MKRNGSMSGGECKPDAKRKRASAQPQDGQRKRGSAQPQDAQRKRDSAQPQQTAQPSSERAFAVWITGLPASGKSTLAAELAAQLRALGIKLAVLESDALRKTFISPAPDFVNSMGRPRGVGIVPQRDLETNSTYDERDREYFYGALAFIGHVLTGHGIAVIFDATANRRFYRDRARQQIPRFAEVFVDCPLEVCIRRDPKGIYRKAREGKASYVPGIQTVYESPESPEIVVRGDRDNPSEAARRIIDMLVSKGFLAPSTASI